MTEEDFWRIRNFLREVFLLNGRLEHSWHVARFDYWRWHLITNCQVCDPMEKVTRLWETTDGQIMAVLHPVGWGEVRMHIHPHYRDVSLEREMLPFAEEHLANRSQAGELIIHTPAFTDDVSRQEILRQLGYIKTQGVAHHWRRDLDINIPAAISLPGYIIRSMGEIDEHPARSWASWRAFHSDEPDGDYDGDASWYRNIQATPLYRRDLDIVAATPDGRIASFCTIFYDDFTRSAVSVLVGTAVEHWRRGLGKAVMVEGMRRLADMGCTRLFATAYDPQADAFYRSVMQTMQVSETWLKKLPS